MTITPLVRSLASAAWIGLFATAAGATQTLFALGDTGDCAETGSAQVAAALKAQPGWRQALLVELGDLAYPTATLERLAECHEPHFAAFKRIAVPGNHDWGDPGAAGFFTLFPEPVPRTVDLAGPWRLLLLDSNLRDAAWQRQIEWLDKTLAGSDGKCLVPLWHHPRWSSGAHGDNALAAPLWSRLAPVASFSLHAHDHHFEALPALDAAGQPAADGLPSFVVGIGGAPLYAAGKRQRSERAIYGQWGFLRLDLDDRRYAWQAINTQGRVIDQGGGQCRPLRRQR